MSNPLPSHYFASVPATGPPSQRSSLLLLLLLLLLPRLPLVLCLPPHSPLLCLHRAHDLVPKGLERMFSRITKHSLQSFLLHSRASTVSCPCWFLPVISASGEQQLVIAACPRRATWRAVCLPDACNSRWHISVFRLDVACISYLHQSSPAAVRVRGADVGALREKDATLTRSAYGF